MKKIVLTGGGTMGHISPNLALIPKLFAHFCEVHYIGSRNSLEQTKVNELLAQFPKLFFHAIPATKLDRKNIFKNLKIPFVWFRAHAQSKKLLKKIGPAAVFSKGGYVSVPVVRSAQKLNIPTIIHESDLSMGLANKLCAKKATTVCSTFLETTKNLPNGVCTFSPVNPKLLVADKINAIKLFNLNPKLKTISITGGSLGSVAINNAVFNILPELVKNYNIIHITGKNKRINFSHQNYHQIEFSDDIGSIFKASDLVISRAGSNTIFELAVLKIPMLLVPLSKRASRGDQIENANYFNGLGIADVLKEEELSSLLPAIQSALQKSSQTKVNLAKHNFTSGLNLLLNEILKASV